MRIIQTLLLASFLSLNAQSLTNSSIFEGTFNPESLESYQSMKDGIHYTVLKSDENNQTAQIVKYAYLDGKAQKTILSSGETIPYFSSYSFSKGESKTLEIMMPY